MNKSDLIMKQLQLFNGWLSRAESMVTRRCDIALSCSDMHDFGIQQAQVEVYRETLDVYSLILKSIDEIISKDDGGDDGEHDAIDPYYM